MSFQIQTDKKNTTEKYQRIIEAAIKVFAKKGFYNSKVSDVAEEADVADGTIYLYFKNKDDLLISIFEHSMDFFFQQAKDHLQGIESPSEKLKKFIALHLALVQKNQNLATVIQIELRSSHKFMIE
jgi:TetR/AcrR family fatty acid metabolism transcriptional regulator